MQTRCTLTLAALLGLSLLHGRLAAGAEPEVDQPLPPLEAAATMRLPPGFKATLFAGEPDVVQPISFCLDDRGRLWVAEAYNYPVHGTKPGDRILIFEDVDNDGRFDKRTVFYDQLNYVTGLEVGFGGVWVVSPPFFQFIPDRDGDDRPDGPPQTLLDGLGNHANSHNLANALAWGPDGWLYGTHGRTNWSLIGKPGVPDAQRIRFDGGVYRYHPVRHVWEPFADGSTNPWGIDWNDVGDAFICNCVDPHLFQVIQGAHYEPWRNRDSSRHAYQRIASIADHLHFVGLANTREGLGTPEEDEAGGGHAHCGTMVYLGDDWPRDYRNSIFMHNIHGKRINCDIPRRVGSGYVASHGPDLVRSRDPWFMGVTLQYGPDGGVFSSDWSDTGECHSVKNTRRQTGRIFKITYGERRPPHRPTNALANDELVALQLHANDWHVRHARRVLQERSAAGQDMSNVHAALAKIFTEQPETSRKLRAMWALFVTGGADEAQLRDWLAHRDEYVRSWAIRLFSESAPWPHDVQQRFLQLAAAGDSAHNRLQLASAAQRLPLAADRWALLAALSRRSEDVSDPNLPLMIWYALEPLVPLDPPRAFALASASALPLLRRHVAQRAASTATPTASLPALLQTLASAPSAARRDLLQGTLEGLSGRRRLSQPDDWARVFRLLQKDPQDEVREAALELALLFDDPTAPQRLQDRVKDGGLPFAARERALRSLIAHKSVEVADLLIDLLEDASLRTVAVRGLAEYQHPQTVPALLELYRQASHDAGLRQDIVQTLASRKEWAAPLLDAVETKKVARVDLSAFTARQLSSLGERAIQERVARLWGDLRRPAAEKERLIADYKRKLPPHVIRQADRASGRVVFQAQCANCHKLFDAGGVIGPDLTGAQRFQLDYLLENLVDPSAAISRDFQMQVVETEAGRVLTGLVVSENDASVTLQSINEKVVVPRREIASRRTSPASMMPEGLLDKLSLAQVRDLIAYLSGPGQVDLPR
ncbi:MAG: PVC-type heme-binding CxxCH protein [Pirellulales bacterium]